MTDSRDSIPDEPADTETPAVPDPAEADLGSELEPTGTDSAWASDDGDDDLEPEVVEGETPAESVDESQAAQPAPAPAATPPLPEGFSSYDELVAAARQAQDLRQTLSTLVRQQQAPAPKPAEPPAWSPPHQGDPLVERALSALRARSPEWEALPEQVRAKAIERDGYLANKWGAYTANPQLFVQEHVLPLLERSVFAQELRALKAAQHRSEGERFLSQHADVLAEQQDRAAFAKALERGMSDTDALRMVALERRVRELESVKQKVNDRQRTIEADRSAQRAQQGNKGRGRAPTSQTGRVGTTDIQKLARIAKARIQAGEA